MVFNIHFNSSLNFFWTCSPKNKSRIKDYFLTLPFCSKYLNPHWDLLSKLPIVCCAPSSNKIISPIEYFISEYERIFNPASAFCLYWNKIIFFYIQLYNPAFLHKALYGVIPLILVPKKLLDVFYCKKVFLIKLQPCDDFHLLLRHLLYFCLFHFLNI